MNLLIGVLNEKDYCNNWKREMLALGEKALPDNRIQNAIAYFRMAEFFMYDGNPEKLNIYNKAQELFR